MRARDGKCQQPSLLPSPRFSRVFSHPVSCYAFEIVMVFLLLTFSLYFLRVRLWLRAVSQSLASNRQISLFNSPLKRSCKLETVVANSRSPPLEPFPSSSLPPSLPSSSVVLMGTLGPFCILKAAGGVSPRARSSNL